LSCSFAPHGGGIELDQSWPVRPFVAERNWLGGLPGFGPLNPYCHVASGFLTQFRGLAAYTIPKIDLLVSTVYQDKPGSPGIDTSLAANYTAPFSVYGPSLGRPVAGER
jgi:hypothetical protein